MSCSPTDEYRLLLVNEYTIEENWWQLGLKKLVKLRINLKKEKNVLPSLPPSLSLLLCANTLFSEGHSNKVWMLLKKLQKIIVSQTTVAMVTVTLATATRATTATATLPVLHVRAIR